MKDGYSGAKLPGSTTRTCSGAICSDEDCCATSVVALCSLYTCERGSKQLRSSKCLAKCAFSDCCDEPAVGMCSSFDCGVGAAPIVGASTMACPGGVCTPELCCLAQCGAYPCLGTDVNLPGSFSKLCDLSPLPCGAGDCCGPQVDGATCGKHTCARGPARSQKPCTLGVCTDEECCAEMTSVLQVIGFSFRGVYKRVAVRELVDKIANSLGLEDDQVVIKTVATQILDRDLKRDKPLEVDEMDRNQRTDVTVAFLACQHVKSSGCVDRLTAERLWMEKLDSVITDKKGLPDGDLVEEFELMTEASVAPSSTLSETPIVECQDGSFRFACADAAEKPDAEITLDNVKAPTWLIGAAVAGLLLVVAAIYFVIHKKSIKKLVKKQEKEIDNALEEGIRMSRAGSYRFSRAPSFSRRNDDSDESEFDESEGTSESEGSSQFGGHTYGDNEGDADFDARGGDGGDGNDDDESSEAADMAQRGGGDDDDEFDEEESSEAENTF
jgi:hypothetical protein